MPVFSFFVNANLVGGGTIDDAGVHNTMQFRSRFLILCAALACVLNAGTPVQAAPLAGGDAWERWRPAAEVVRLQVDHAPWGALLLTYLEANDPSGINRFAYDAVTIADRELLDSYINSLSMLPVARLTPLQQQAYWINLYNALTVQVILDHPGVSSIREIRSGWFSPGPWDLKLVEVNGVALTLNDIEHRILRPIFGDPRVHFAVNCASLGCPNLGAEPYLADRLDVQLDTAARAFINHPRGASISDSRLTLSSIFKWYGDDFGATVAERLEWIAAYAKPGLSEQLTGWDGRVSYEYDWRLNAPG
jgi:hypothetical protein